MKVLVLGAGLQGSACAYDLLNSPSVTRVVLADVEPDRLTSFLEPFRGDPRLDRVALDARDHDAVRAAMEAADACMNALPYRFNLEMARLAVESGTHYADLGGNTEIVFEQLRLDEAARERGLSVIPDSGLAPGLANVLAAEGIRAVDAADAVRIRVGGLPQDPRPPLNYHIVYSLEGVLDYYTTPSWVLRDGMPQQVEALSEVEEVEFPPPVGRLEAFHTGGGLSTMPWAYQGKINTMEYKTLRYPGHAVIMRAIRDLGLVDAAPIRVGDEEVVPRDVFIACARRRLEPLPSARDLVAVRVEIDGRRDGRPAHIAFDLIDRHDEATGISAMARTTGFSLSITGQLQATGRVLRTGACTPDRAVPAETYTAELEKRGIVVQRRGP